MTLPKPRFLTKKSFRPPAAPPNPEAKQAVVFVPGVIESMLMLDKGTDRERPFYQDALKLVKRRIGGFLAGSAQALLFRRYDRLNGFGESLSEAAFGALFQRPDGTSVHTLSPVISGAAESSYEAILAADRWKDVGYGARIAMEVAPRVGGDNVFVFCYDWRRGVVKVAEDLSRFLTEVREKIGDKELALCGCSYGCQVIAQYLYAGGEKPARIVFNAPAWRGTALFRELQQTDKSRFFFNAPAAARVLTRFAGWELYPEPWAKLLPQRLVNVLAYATVRRSLSGGLLYCPGLWSCCAVDDYEEMKRILLDPEKSAPLIEETDAAQYGVMRRIPEVLADARKAGVGLWAVMNDGTPLMAGQGYDGDGVIDVTSGSGGLCLPEGQTARTDPGRRVSPTGRCDLTDALLPDRTWVIRGQVHGQSWWDDASRGLIADLLLTGQPETVDADPARPQFMDALCPADGVSLRFEEGASCLLDFSGGPVKAVIRNDSPRKRVLLLSVEAREGACRITDAKGLLHPGQSRPVTLTPAEDAAASVYGSVVIRFVKSDPLPLIHTRVIAVRRCADEGGYSDKTHGIPE